MINKSFKILSLSILTLLVLASFVSATITFSDIPTLSQTGNSFTITIESDQNETIEFSIENITENEKMIVFDPIENITLNSSNPSQKITINYNISDFDFEFGETYSTTLTANGDVSENVTQDLSFEETSFYNKENEGNLEVSHLELNSIEGFGDDDDYWYPLDEVEVEFDVENNGEWDIENIEIKFCLWDEEAKDCILDEDDVKINKDDFDLDENDEQTVKITFQVDPDELTAGNNDYTVYVSAIGNIDDNDAEDYDGDETGDSDFKEIEIITDDKFVIIDNVEIQPDSVSCGGTVELTAKVWNVGDEDLDDDEIYIWIYNKAFGIDEVVEFSSGIDAMDYEKISLSLEIPEDLEEEFYVVKLTAYDDEDMDDEDIFETAEEEDEASYNKIVDIEGNCISEPQVIVSVGLESEAKAGEDLIVKATITNTGDKLVIYTLNMVDYTNWATLVNIEPNTIILNAGESKDILVTFNINKGVSGEKSFNIEVLSEDEVIKIFTVEPFTIEEQTGFNFAGITGNIISEGNWYLWGIGALNVLLVVIIIIVAFRVAKKSE